MTEELRYRVDGAVLSLVRGDITKQSTEAIVNAANAALKGGGGVDGAIHRAGGPTILQECAKIGRCPTGSAVVTDAGDLSCNWVIHAVGPRYRDGESGEADLLASAYRAAMTRAREIDAESVALPSLSTGAYGYPVQEAAEIAVQTVTEELLAGGPRLARFVLFDQDTFDAYHAAATRLLGARKKG